MVGKEGITWLAQADGMTKSTRAGRAESRGAITGETTALRLGALPVRIGLPPDVSPRVRH
jgi:hypothetical protein